MSVRFVIGRAGSGKTRHCLTAIRRHLEEGAVGDPRLVLLVPEQAAMQMERAILDVPAGPGVPDVPGAARSAVHRTEVLSFRRLAFRILNAAGGATRFALSEPARTMVVRHLLSSLSGELRYFRRGGLRGSASPGLTGAAARLAATIAELIHEAVSPEQIGAIGTAAGATSVTGDHADERRSDLSSDPARAALLHDLSLLYAGYLDYLGETYLDPLQHLDVARQQLDACDWLRGAMFWVDGFASLSGQEVRMLVELARRAGHMDVTLLLDPSQVERVAGPTVQSRLFQRTGRTFAELGALLRKEGIAVEDPLPLPTARRFPRNRTLALIEANWAAAVADPDGRFAESSTAERVELVELPTRRHEADYAVWRVAQWVQNPARNYRYRDIALIVRDIEPYHDSLSHALRSHRIPFFMDHRRSIAHHPLVELVRSGPALVQDDLDLGTMRILLKTGLFALEADAADELENYVLAHAIAGASFWGGDDWTFPPRRSMPREAEEPAPYDQALIVRVNRSRRIVWQGLAPWIASANAGSARTGKDWADGLVEWVLHLKVNERLAQWAEEAERDGDVGRADEHRQAWREVMSCVDDLRFALAGESFDVRALGEVLEAGLAGLSLGLVPPSVDAVLVSAIERSRHPEIKAAVILGFNDGVFPSRPSEDAILGDEDRAYLREAGVRVRGGIREQLGDESLLSYIALTRPSEELVVTYARADEKGRELLPSPYLGALRAACGGAEVRRVADAVRTRETWDVLNEQDLVRRFVSEFRTRPALADDDAQKRVLWNTLYERYRGELSARPWAAQAFRGLTAESDDRLSPASVRALYGDPLRTSVSRMESFATCPFQHFARHGLQLAERDEAELEVTDIGSVHHAILEDFLSGVIRENRSLGEMSEVAIADGLAESCARVARQIPEGGPMFDARNAYLLRHARAELLRILSAQRRVARAGRTRPRHAELGFGFDEPGGLPPLKLTTPKGRTVLLRGYIDRVDIVELADEALGVVIDYKRTRDKRLDLTQTFHGMSIQLLAYLLALTELGTTPAGRPIHPLAALFVSLAPRYELVAHPSLAEDADASQSGVFKPRGLIRFEALGALEELQAGQQSAHYAVKLKKDGGISHFDSSDAAERKQFATVLAFTRRRLGELADGVLSGDVAVSPFRLRSLNPCTWCPMLSVCRFDWDISNVRFLESLKRSEAFARMEAVCGPPPEPDGREE